MKILNKAKGTAAPNSSYSVSSLPHSPTFVLLLNTENVLDSFALIEVGAKNGKNYHNITKYKQPEEYGDPALQPRHPEKLYRDRR